MPISTIENLISYYPKLPSFFRQRIFQQLEQAIRKPEDTTQDESARAASLYSILRYMDGDRVDLIQVMLAWDSASEHCYSPVVDKMEADRNFAQWFLRPCWSLRTADLFKTMKFRDLIPNRGDESPFAVDRKYFQDLPRIVSQLSASITKQELFSANMA